MSDKRNKKKPLWEQGIELKPLSSHQRRTRSQRPNDQLLSVDSINSQSQTHAPSTNDKKYIVLSENAGQVVLIYDNNKFVSNGMWEIKSTNVFYAYFRCNQYRAGCTAKFKTIFDKTKVNESFPYGKISNDKFQPNHTRHADKWSDKEAQRQW